MLRLARTLRFDGSDAQIFARAAEPGEWAIPGGFAFADWTETDLQGKARQAFANGWLSLESFGRATLVGVAQIEPAELEALALRLAGHLLAVYGAPDTQTARAAAEAEIAFMQELCEGHAPNTLLAVSRSLDAAGVREAFRAIVPADAELAAFAVHATGPADGP